MTLETAQQFFSEGDTNLAFQLLEQLMEYPGQLESPQEWQERFQLFAHTARSLGPGNSIVVIEAVAEDPDSVEKLLDFAREAVQQGFFGIAATVFDRANRLRPGQPEMLAEFASCLSEMSRA